MKKDPSHFRKYTEQCFLRPDLNFFLEFQEKKIFAIIFTLKMTINFFFQKNLSKKFANKSRQKNLPTKVVEKICQHKMASGCMLLAMKSMCKNTCCNEKSPEPFQEMSGTMFFKARSKIFFGILKKKLFTKIVTLKMTIKRYSFFKRTCKENLPRKLVKKIWEKKN